MSYLQYINQFSKSGKPVSDLSRFSALLEQLSNPQDDLQFIHVAGTNGKGSICEYLSCALIAENKRVGKFTSPYIVCINERICIDGQPISDEIFSAAVSDVEKAVEKCQEKDFSQFEILTAAAFLIFKAEGTDIVVLETGVGGLLDCTNVVTPLVSVIGRVDFDHMNILGDTIEQIAAHKAGIIKEGIPCVSYPKTCQHEQVFPVIELAAKEKKSRLIQPNVSELKIKELSLFGNIFTYKGESYSTTMGGEHQVYNAITAIEALELLHVNPQSTKQSLNTAVISARLQVVRKNPVVVIDGGHNPSGIEAATKLISPLPCKKTAVFGMIAAKDYNTTMLKLLPKMDNIVFVSDFAEGAVPPEELLRRAAELRFDRKNIAIKSYKDAVGYAKGLDNSGVVLVIGSLYLAAAILESGDEYY